MDLIKRIADELAVAEQRVRAAVDLLDGGASVPFIARYRKEATSGLDDTQLRHLESRLSYLRELDERRETVLNSIREQNALTPALERSVLAADTKTALEDLYLPFKPKRSTKAQMAREAGLEPLAASLLDDPRLEPAAAAIGYLNPGHGITDVSAALDGARHILMERFAEDAELLGELRAKLWREGVLRSSVAPGKEQAAANFKDYFDYTEAIGNIPSHRALALFRGSEEDVLRIDLAVALDEDAGHAACERLIIRRFGIGQNNRPADGWLLEAVRQAWKIKLLTRIALDLKQRLREAAEAEAIRVFACNLKDLLLAAPAGPRTTLGLDPGLRSGVKAAVVGNTGTLLETATVYPHAPHQRWDEAIALLAGLIEKHAVELVSIGNGAASRETDRLIADLIERHPGLAVTKVMVSEAGASVYSASALAAREFPQLDVALRGAVSIARRVQDPLAELVKIEPKAIGVGQYQHDVNQALLSRELEAVVEDCVNSVGVDLNTASVPLLKHVSGLSQSLGQNIVAFRDANGPFRSREELRTVPRLGPKTFEQAAGFLRIRNGDNPLDASAVHPESYSVVEKILRATGKDIRELLGNGEFLKRLDAKRFTDETFGLPTVADILSELEKPGRDPRPTFVSARFKDGVDAIADLEPGMQLEGVVTNVANFGAFIDIGVHQDGLVHISRLADRFVKDPREVVKVGDVVSVKVLAIDLSRRRIGLTMRCELDHERSRENAPRAVEKTSPRAAKTGGQTAKPANTMADAFARASGKKP